MSTQVSNNKLNYRTTNNSPRQPDKEVTKEAIIDRLKAERTKIRTQLVVSSYVDNWPYVEVLPEKLRRRLLHKLRLVDEALFRAKEALLRANKIRQQNRAKKRQLLK